MLAAAWRVRSRRKATKCRNLFVRLPQGKGVLLLCFGALVVLVVGGGWWWWNTSDGIFLWGEKSRSFKDDQVTMQAYFLSEGCKNRNSILGSDTRLHKVAASVALMIK